MFNTEFDIIGLIGVILLIGIVQKNAIMMIAFAIEARRSRQLSSYDAIFQACKLRFRPIMMTTTAAILGAKQCYGLLHGVRQRQACLPRISKMVSRGRASRSSIRSDERAIN
jgi:hypothetical protein